MPGDDSSPIPIYFLSLMLLKSPTRSANMEGAQGRGSEDWGQKGAQQRWYRQLARGPETWVQILPSLHLSAEPWGTPGLCLSLGNDALLCPPQGTIPTIY